MFSPTSMPTSHMAYVVQIAKANVGADSVTQSQLVLSLLKSNWIDYTSSSQHVQNWSPVMP